MSCCIEAASAGVRAVEIDFGNRALYFDRSRHRQRRAMMMKLWPSSDCLTPAARFFKAGSSSVGLHGIKSLSPVRSMSSRPGSLIVGGVGGGFGKPVRFSSMKMHHQAVAAAAAAIAEEGEGLRHPPCLMVPAGLLVAEGEEEVSFVELTTTTIMEKKKKKKKEEEEKNSTTNDDDYYDLLSVEGKKLVLKKKIKKNLWLPWQREVLSPDDALCLGSSHGWLVFIHPRNCSIYLYNPLLNSFPYIPLPPVETLTGVHSSLRRQHTRKTTTTTSMEFTISGEPSNVSSEKVSSYVLQKIVLSSPPPHGYYSTSNNNNNKSNDDCTVMAIHGGNTLAFCRIGDTSWTDLNGRPYCSQDLNGIPYRYQDLNQTLNQTRDWYRDLVYFREHQLFYCMGLYELEAWDLRNPASPKSSITIDYWPSRYVRGRFLAHAYLVASSGDLLMVERLGCDDSRLTVGFDVYKLDFAGKKWVGVPSLGDGVLFVGANHSCESLSIHDFPAGTLIPNSIYFTPFDIYGQDSGNDLGVFNLEDKSIYWCQGLKKKIKKKKKKAVQRSPTWIVPQLSL